METIPSSAPYAPGGSARRTRRTSSPLDRHPTPPPGPLARSHADTHRIEQTRQVVAGMLATANWFSHARSGNAFAGLIGFNG